ncbi:MAG: hypothetical protein U0136_18850 [Bdellovibrionota bacterium]
MTGSKISPTRPYPSAIVVWPGDMQNMLRPNVREPLKSARVDIAAAEADTEAYINALLMNYVRVNLLGVPLDPTSQSSGLRALIDKHGENWLHVYRDEEFSRWLRTPPGADAVFPEDWGRLLTSALDGSTYFISSHMGATERIGEHAVGVETALAQGLLKCDQVIRIMERNERARCEAGDILELRIDDRPVTIFGLSERSNLDGFETWTALSEEKGFGAVYSARVFPNVGLHLTTAAGALDRRTVLFDPTLVSGDDLAKIPGIDLLETHPDDHGNQNAANCLYFPTTGRVLMDDRFEKTMERVRRTGREVVPCPNAQHAIGAGGLTCRSLRSGWMVA